MVAHMSQETHHYNKGSEVFDNILALKHEVFENNLPSCKDISEKKISAINESQNKLLDGVEEYYHNFDEANESDKKFKAEIKPIFAREPSSFTNETLLEMIEVEKRFIKQSQMKMNLYQWHLNEKDKSLKAWEIIESECDARLTASHKRRRPNEIRTQLSQSQDF